MCMKKLACVLLLISFPLIAQSNKPNKTKGDQVKTIEGCLMRDGGDFYLQPSPANGDQVHLSAANQDLASLVGRRVRVHGSEQPPKAAQQAAAGAQPVTPVEKQPPPSTVPSGTPDPNVQVTQLPQSAQAGEGTQGFRGNPPAHQLYVSSIEAVAGKCKPSSNQEP
jgi:hypothetical protein